MAAHSYSIPTSLNLDGLTIEDAYFKIDQEIAELQARLCSLRTLRNTLAPISKVPTEVLSKIFLHTNESADWQGPFAEEDLAALSTRFVVSWVCRHWRDIAIAIPRLWTTISMDTRDCQLHEELAQELLVRSRDLDLTINLPRPTEDVLELFHGEMHRTQHLRLYMELTTLAAIKLLEQAAPVLASLEIERLDTIPESMFSGVHPHLHSLTLIDAEFDLPLSLITPILTKLHLSDIDRVDPNSFIDVLSSLQSLTELVLIQALEFGDYNTVMPPPPRIRLPHLESLEIAEFEHKAENIFQFLRRFDIPHTEVTLCWQSYSDFEPPSLGNIKLALQSYLQDLSIIIRHLTLREVSPDFFAEISSSPSEHRYINEFPEQELDEENTELFLGFISPLDDLKTLSTSEIPAKTDLSQLPDLSEVSLFAPSALEEFVAQCKVDPQDEDKKPFPALKILTIDGIKDTNFGDLEEVLAARYEAGMGLNRLVFVRCPEVDVDKFQDFVDNISVEGQ